MKVTLKNVRLSFPALFHKAKFEGQETKFEATFLLDKEDHAETIDMLKKAINEKIKNDLKGAKLGADKLCLRDGDEASYDGYAGCMSLKASNQTRPLIIDRDKTPLAEEDGKPYGGCYVNAMVELWAQSNAYGKRINAKLLGVQFYKDGEAFSSGNKASADDFESFDSEEDVFA